MSKTGKGLGGQYKESIAQGGVEYIVPCVLVAFQPLHIWTAAL